MTMPNASHAQLLSLLEWYHAMGADEILAEKPQNHLITPPISARPPATAIPSEAINAIMQQTQPLSESSVPAFKPEIPKTAQASIASTAALLAETRALAEQANSLIELKAAVSGFKSLGICQSATQAAFAEGAENADLLVIGEAPSADEDRSGTPFCGESGRLLDHILAAIGCSRAENTFLTHSVYWRPPGNRPPSPEEIEICRPFVQRTIALIQPKAILLVGGVATRSVLEVTAPLSRLRGRWHTAETLKEPAIPIRATYHPTYLLHQPKQKKLAWEDAVAVLQQLEKLK